MDKLAEFSGQTERFLRSLSRDLGIEAKKGEWLALNFGNESFSFDGEYVEDVPQAVAERGYSAVELITGDDPVAACESGLMGYGSASEFAQIGKYLDPGESFFVGLYTNGLEPNWREVTFRKNAELKALLTTPIVTSGSIQGFIHSWTTGAEPPFIQLRELATGGLIRCAYDASDFELHRKLLAAHERERQVIHAYGISQWDRAKNSIIEMVMSDIELAESLTESDFNRIFGSLPGFTGPMTTDEYIERMREGGE